MAIIPSTTRFVGIATSVDLTERKSVSVNAETQPYTMQDIIDTTSVAASVIPAASFTWSAGYANLVNAADNRIPFDATEIADANFTLLTPGPGTHSVEVTLAGVYQVNTLMHFFDIGSDMKFETKIFAGAVEPLSLVKVIQSETYGGTNTNQVMQGSSLISLNAGDKVGIVVVPSANAPFPANLDGLEPTVELIKIK